MKNEPRIEQDEYEEQYAEDDESDEEISDVASDEENEEKEMLNVKTMRMIAEMIKSEKEKHELSVEGSW